MNKTTTKTLLAGLLVIALVLIGYFFLDRPISLAAHELRHTAWYTMAKWLSLCSNHFVTNVIVAVGLLYACWDSLQNGLTPRSRAVFYVCTVVACTMMVGDVLKELGGRARPPLLFDKNIYGFFPMHGGFLHSSFPSGHALRAFSLLTALGFVLPRLRIPALALATLIAMSRVLALKHYPSDILFGAFLGITAAVWGWRIFFPYGNR